MKITLRLLKQILNMCLLITTIITFSSCSIFSAKKIQPPTTYLLTDLPKVKLKRHVKSLSLLVLQPEATPAYNTTSMAYSIQPYQIAYFGKNRWAETPSQMLHPLIVQTLQNSRHFYAVVTPPYAGRFDYILRIQLLEFLQDFSHQQNIMRIKIRAQISRIATNRVATKVFIIEEPIAQETPYSGVFAANRATVNLLKQLAKFASGASL